MILYQTCRLIFIQKTMTGILLQNSVSELLFERKANNLPCSSWLLFRGRPDDSSDQHTNEVGYVHDFWWAENRDFLFFSNSITSESISHRQVTEIQLKTLLNEHICYLPDFNRQATESLPSDQELSVEEISEVLKTQPFIIERIINALILSSTDENISKLNRNIIQKLTRVFTSTLDVRCLVFFKMLDENCNQYVEREELSSFYAKYLNSIQCFNKDLIPRFICIILKRYHLDTVSLLQCKD